MKNNPNQSKLEHYQQLLDISKDLVSNHDLSSMLNKITTTACELSNSEASSILLYNERVKELYFQSATGLDEPVMHGLVVPLDGSIAGWVVKQGKTVLINDVHNDPRFFEGIEKKTQIITRSLVGIPLIVQEKVIGILEVINNRNGGFSEYEIEILTILGTQAALAIENTRLFQQSDQISELVHEIRTPLSSISTAAFLLQQAEVSKEQRLSYSKTIYSEAQRLSDMATTFLDLARLESGRTSFKPSWINLKVLVDEVLEIFLSQTEDSRINLTSTVPAEYPEIYADRDKLKQVFINLVSNAIKYNQKGGHIIISADLIENEHLIIVKDDGIGMSSEIVKHLFERFYRSHRTEDQIQGTGLGLSICKKIIENHNGRVSVKSEPNVGTEFEIWLPYKAH
jgi:signal transduction histidine kinase